MKELERLVEVIESKNSLWGIGKNSNGTHQDFLASVPTAERSQMRDRRLSIARQCSAGFLVYAEEDDAVPFES